MVSVRTVTEQLLYEIGDPRGYQTPDVTVDFTSLQLTQDAPDRVRVSGARGLPAPPTLKVDHLGGDRNGMMFVPGLGLDPGRQAALVRKTLFDRSWWRAALRERRRPPDPHRQGGRAEQRGGDGRCCASPSRTRTPRKVGRAFAATPRSRWRWRAIRASSPRPARRAARARSASTGRRWCRASWVHEVVVTDDGATACGRGAADGRARRPGSQLPILPQRLRPRGRPSAAPRSARSSARARATRAATPTSACGGGRTRPRPSLGWRELLTVERLRRCWPEAATLEVRALRAAEHLLALNFVVVGLLRRRRRRVDAQLDPQAKGLGADPRAKLAPIPVALLG